MLQKLFFCLTILFSSSAISNSFCENSPGYFVYNQSPSGDFTKGGFIASTASIKTKRIKIGPFKGKKTVLDSWISSKTQICKKAKITGSLITKGSVEITDRSVIKGSIILDSDTKISFQENIKNIFLPFLNHDQKIQIEDKSQILGNAKISGSVTISGSSIVSEFAEIKGLVTLTENTKIKGYSSIKGHIQIGQDVVIRDHCTVNGSIKGLNIQGQITCEDSAIIDGSGVISNTVETEAIFFQDHVWMTGYMDIQVNRETFFKDGYYENYSLIHGQSRIPKDQRLDLLYPKDSISHIAKDKNIGDFDTESVCTICFDSIIGSGIISETTHCKHLFHKDCLQTWLQYNQACPSCYHHQPSCLDCNSAHP